ncbi:MAG: hypothetical protein V1889_02085 [archaeon]
MKTQTIPEGTFFAELENSQKSAIRYAIENGKILQTQIPEIEKKYRNGNSLREIVEEHDLENKFGVCKKTAEIIVTYALKGYHGEWNMFTSPSYNGLMTEEEYAKIAEEHHIKQGRILGEKIGHKSGVLTFRKQTGVHGMTYLEKHIGGQKGIVAQGHIPWSNDEIKTLYELVQDPFYKRKTQIHAQNIAKEINKKFHNGNPVRDNTSVTKAFNRYKNFQTHI